jgi:phospholipid/cholesterol/gamma-HCH transport system ATP-binding protein
MPPQHDGAAVLEVRDLEVAAGGRVVQRGIGFDLARGEILVVVGGSGSGKSTLLRHLVGLEIPEAGSVRMHGLDLHHGDPEALAALRRRFGVMFQAGALWSSMTLGENLMLPMRLFSTLDAATRERRARERLAMVGLEDGFDLLPAALSGGMRKRAALARALALDPELLFLDEPGSGLDPINAARLDELVLSLRRDLGVTVLMVTHEIAGIFSVADRMLFLDGARATMTALGPPSDLLASGPDEVRRFLRRGADAGVAA